VQVMATRQRHRSKGSCSSNSVWRASMPSAATTRLRRAAHAPHEGHGLFLVRRTGDGRVRRLSLRQL
jgi:hypothetical protein